MSELIDRQRAIDILESYKKNLIDLALYGEDSINVVTVDCCRRLIEGLPPARGENNENKMGLDA